jgi:hypothetical protein
MQEHMNYWIKVFAPALSSTIEILPIKQNFYKAHGSSASWEWLEMIAPCVEVLRHLAKTMNSLLGTDTGTRHEPVDLSHDIPELMASLDNHDVYRMKGRKLDDDDEPVVDVVTAGLQSLTDNSSNPLDEFNKAFTNLQARRRLVPVVGGPRSSQSTNQPSISTPTQALSVPRHLPTTSTNPIDSEIVTQQRTDSSTGDKDNGSSGSGSDQGNELSGGESEDDEEEAYKRAFAIAVEELEEHTLTRDRAEDVALDMDEDDYDNSGSEEYSDDENENRDMELD